MCTLTNMVTKNLIRVSESSFAKRMIMFEIIIEGFAEKVQTVKMVKTLNIGRVAAAVFLGNFDLVR